MEMRRFKQLRFRQLRAFVELARAGSFAAVAEKLELSVPSVWQQVRTLEKAFDCELVHTEGRRLVFTDPGQLLLNMAAAGRPAFRAEGGDHLVFHDLSRLFGHEAIDLCVRRSRFQPPHEQAFCELLLEACARV